MPSRNNVTQLRDTGDAQQTDGVRRRDFAFYCHRMSLYVLRHCFERESFVPRTEHYQSAQVLLFGASTRP